MREKVKERYIWGLAASVFIVFQMGPSRDVVIEGIVVCVVFAILSLRWCIVPFLLSRDMPLPSFSNTVLKKGEHDSVRFIYFVIGVFMFLAAIGL